MWNAVRTVDEDKTQQIWGPISVGHEPTFSTYDRMWKNKDMEGDSVSNLGFLYVLLCIQLLHHYHKNY